jgi:membrane protease YdiL (CAAX protease family)
VSPKQFFVTTFVLSWAVWMPLMLIRLDVLPPFVPLSALTPIALLGVLMPAVAATALTARASGRAGTRALWRRLFIRPQGRWWLAVLTLQPLVVATRALLADASGLVDPVRLDPALAAGTLISTTVFLVVASTGEEVGWRGLALPALQSRHGAVRASIVLGLVTATWHLPYWVLQGALEDQDAGYLALNYAFILALTFQLTWLVNGTGGSVLSAVGFHVSFNVMNVGLLPVTAGAGAFAVLTVLELLVSATVVRHLTPSTSAI